MPAGASSSSSTKPATMRPKSATTRVAPAAEASSGRVPMEVGSVPRAAREANTRSAGCSGLSPSGALTALVLRLAGGTLSPPSAPMPRASSAPYGSVGGCDTANPPWWLTFTMDAATQPASSKPAVVHVGSSRRASSSSTGTPSSPPWGTEPHAVARATVQLSSETSQSSPSFASKTSSASRPITPAETAGCQNELAVP